MSCALIHASSRTSGAPTRRALLATALFLLFLAVVFPGKARAAVAFGASANVYVTTASTTGSITLNLSSLPASNTMLLVGIAIDSSSTTSATVSSVKWGGSSGTSLSLIASCSTTASYNNAAHIEIWSLANPSNVSSTVAITISSSQVFYAGAAGFTGVSGLGTCVVANGAYPSAGTSNSLTPTVPSGGAAFDTTALNTQTSGATITVGSGQTTVAIDHSGDSAGAASYELAPVSSMSDSWSTSSSVWAQGAVPLNPSVGRKGQVIIGSANRDEVVPRGM